MKKLTDKKGKSLARVLSILLAAALVLGDSSISVLAADSSSIQTDVYDEEAVSVTESAEDILDAEEIPVEDDLDEAAAEEEEAFTEDIENDISDETETVKKSPAETTDTEASAEDASEEDAGIAEEEVIVTAYEGDFWISSDGKGIIGFSGTGDVVIPSKYTYIGAEAFAGDDITSVTFEDGSEITTIENNAFKNCAQLSVFDASNCKKLTLIQTSAFEGAGTEAASFTVTLPKELNQIMDKGFKGCTTLKSITLPGTLGILGNEVFNGCSKLTDVYINSNLTTVGTSVFTGCALKNVSFESAESGEKDITEIPSQLFNNATFSGDITLEIPASVTKVGTKAFMSASVNAVTFATGSALQVIDESAFSGSRISSIDLPAGLTTIGKSAFSGCKFLTSITIPDSVTTIGESTFSNCENLVTATLPSNSKFTAIPNSMFFNTKLGSIDIPEAVTVIGDSAFKQSNLSYIDLSKMTAVGSSAFEKCPYLLSVKLPETSAYTKVEKNTFSNCRNLGYLESAYTLVIPDNITEIDDGGFFATSYQIVEGANNLQRIGNIAFANVPLTTFVFPESLTTIGTQAFTITDEDRGLSAKFTDVVIPKNVTTIGASAFARVPIKTLDIRSTVLSSCGKSIFNKCTIQEVKFPNNITSLPDNLFYEGGFVTGMVLKIPSTVTKIGAYAFYKANIAGVTYITPAGVSTNSSAITEIGDFAFAENTFLNYVIPEKVTKIGASAFENNQFTEFTELVIPKGVKEIGSQAFKGCIHLQKITFTGGVTANVSGKEMLTGNELVSIGDEVFSGCSELASIDLPQGLGEIGASAFENCKALTHIYVPSTVTAIGTDAFTACSEELEIVTGSTTYAYEWLQGTDLSGKVLTEEDTKGGKKILCRITYVLGDEDAVNDSRNVDYFECTDGHETTYFYLPELAGCEYKEWYEDAKHTIPISSTTGKTTDLTVYAKPVAVDINRDMFTWDETTITGLADGYEETDYIIVPKDCEYIKDGAFKANKYLKRIIIEDEAALRKIGVSAFDGCTSLRTLDLRNCDKLSEIETAAFRGCSSLTKLVFPVSDSASFILGTSSFESCTSLTTLTIPKGMSGAGEHSFYKCSALQTINFNAPQFDLSAESDKTYAIFGGCNISEVNIADTVTTIPKGMFANAGFAPGFTLVIPDSIVVIEDQAFRFARLEALDLSKATKLREIGELAFSEVKPLAKVEIPDSVQTIGNEAFSKTVSLNSVTIGTKATKLGTGIFTGCTALESCTIKAPITEIPANTFNGDKALQSVVVQDSVTSVSNNAFKDCIVLGSADISANLEMIGNDAFNGCTALTGVKMPDSLVYLGTGAFGGCSSIASVTFSENLFNIPDNAFKGCKALKTVKLSSSANSVGASAFEDCTGITSADLGNCLVTIGNKAFCNNTALAAVTVGDKLETIGDSAFESTIIKNIALPETVTKIGASAFKNTALKAIELPKSLTTLGSEAFKDAKQLTTISMNAAALTKCDATKDYGAFSGCDITTVNFGEGITLIPDNLFYRAQFSTSMNFVIPATVTKIGDKAFSGSLTWGKTNINTVVFEEGSQLTTIGKEAFRFSLIREFEMPDTVTTIGAYAFADCPNLKKIVLSSALTAVPDYAFQNDSALDTVQFKGAAVTKIGVSAFDGATSLTAIEIPGNTTEIGDKAFNNCGNLSYVFIPSTVTKIGKDSFNGAGVDSKDGLTIATTEGSAAFKWADENNITTTTDGIHSIMYEYNGGTKNPLNISYYIENKGVLIDEVEFYPATKAGYNFTGWYLDAECESASINKISELPAEYRFIDITLHAGFELPWESTTYSISFTPNAPTGFNVKAPATISVSGDEVVKLYTAEEVTCDGIRLVGWNTKKDGTGKTYAPGAEVSKLAKTNKQAVPLYGMWVTDEYTITYDLNGGTNAAANPEKYNTGEVVSKPIKLENPTAPSGMIFVGWYDETWTKITEIKKGARGNKTIHALYSSTSYFTLCLKLNGKETVAGDQLVDANKGIKMPIACDVYLPTADAISRPGYIFKGWCTKSKQSSKSVLYAPGTKLSAVQLGVTKPKKKVTLYAIWEPITYNVSCDLNGGYFKPKDAIKSAAIKTHTVVKSVKLYLPKRDGYVFAGWDNTLTKEVEKYKTSLPKGVATDAALQAVWTPITYKVTFYGNGGNIGTVSKLVVTNQEYDKVVAAPKAEEMNCAGRTFVGWNTKKNGLGKMYPADADLKNLTTKKGASIKLYAIWR